MKCEQIKKFVLGRLGEEVSADMQLHLDGCESCRALYSQQLMMKELCSLRSYEEPKGARVESTVATVMRAVRLHEERYETQQDRLMWLFTEPRYGVAMLFLIFLGLNLVRSDHQQYQAPLDDDLFGADIMLLNEAPPAALSNGYHYADFQTDPISGIPLLNPVSPVNLADFEEDEKTIVTETNP